MKGNFYVDDSLKSSPSFDRAICSVYGLRDLLAKGGFHLAKWTSNCRELLVSIQKEERAEEVYFDLDLELDKLSIQRALECNGLLNPTSSVLRSL